jgi:cytoskeletal protein CcmA (bactofilin family)
MAIFRRPDSDLPEWERERVQTPTNPEKRGSDTMSLTEKVGQVVKHAGHAGAVTTVVGDETTVEGKVSSKGNLHIDGRVVGEIFADDTVIIGPSGNVEGNIEARTILVGGTVKGNVRASDKLEIQPQGTIHGDIFTPFGHLIILEGARLEGKCAMSKDIQLRTPAVPAKVVDATMPPMDKSKSELR